TSRVCYSWGLMRCAGLPSVGKPDCLSAMDFGEDGCVVARSCRMAPLRGSCPLGLRPPSATATSPRRRTTGVRPAPVSEEVAVVGSLRRAAAAAGELDAVRKDAPESCLLLAGVDCCWGRKCGGLAF